jgi:hypothetical protein
MDRRSAPAGPPRTPAAPPGSAGEGFTALGAWLADLRERVVTDPAELPREPTLLLIEAVDRLLGPHLPCRGHCPACSRRRHKVVWPCEVYQSTRRVLLGDRCVPRPVVADGVPRPAAAAAGPAPAGPGGVIPARPAGTILALHVPAGADAPCRVVRLRPTAVALSDALGGVLLDDTVHELDTGRLVRVYVAEDRPDTRLPANRRAGGLLRRAAGRGTARRGAAGRVVVRGDALMAGVDADGNDCDLPAELLPAVRHW